MINKSVKIMKFQCSSLKNELVLSRQRGAQFQLQNHIMHFKDVKIFIVVSLRKAKVQQRFFTESKIHLRKMKFNCKSLSKFVFESECLFALLIYFDVFQRLLKRLLQFIKTPSVLTVTR